MAVRFTRVLSEGDSGVDVEAVGRAMCAAGVLLPISVFQALPKALRQRYGSRKVDACRKLEQRFGLKRDGIYGKSVHEKLAKFFDGRAESLMLAYEPPPPPLIAPRQGSSSLHSSLHQAFSLCRNMGLSDLGTYNPASRLPSGGLSDHAVYPARAFDCGIWPQTGMDNPTGRSAFYAMVGRPEVEYAILGDRIWTSDGRGVHAYGSGGHENHLHTSGHR